MRLSEANNLVFVQELFGEEIVLSRGPPHGNVGKEDIVVGDLRLGAGRGNLNIFTDQWGIVATIGFSNLVAGRM